MEDPDGDGLGERCEFALAEAFAPTLLADRRDCLWREGDGRLQGGYFFAVRPVAGGVRVAYLPAYLEDCGWSGVACWFRGPRCSGHTGDSEVIALDLSREPDGWRVAGVFISAHCRGAVGKACRWARADDLAAFAWDAGPRVWVARDKHAHYASRGACESAKWRRERCADSPVEVRFPVVDERQNIGARGRSPFGPDGCVTERDLPLGGGRRSSSRECLWSVEGSFRGWQDEARGPAPQPYGAILAALGFE
jgi:hypothetical protein